MTPGPQIAPDASPGARPSRVLIVVLLAAIAAGVVLRCDGLGRKVPWYDEVGTMLRISGHTEAEVATFAAERPRAPRELLERFQRPSRDARASAAASAVVRAVVEDEPPHSPGYFVAASLWTRAAGGDPAAVRALSAAASIASLPLLGLLAWRLFGNRWVALATVALAALSPVQIRYAQEARAYALWSLTLLATSLAMLAASCRGRGGASSTAGTHARRDGAASAAWLAVTLSFATALYVHPLSLLALPALLLLAHDASATPRAARAQVVGGALALGAAIGLWVPWTMVVIAHGERAARNAGWMGDAYAPPSLVRAWLGVATSLLYRPSGPGGVLDGVPLPGMTLAWLALGAAASALIVTAFFRVARAAPPAARRFVPALALVPFVTLALADLGLGGRRSSVDRYLLPAWLATELAVAFLLVSRGPRERLRRATLLLVLALGAATALRTRPLEVWWNTEPETLAGLQVLETSLRSHAAPIVVTDAPPLRLLQLARHLPADASVRSGREAAAGLAAGEWPRVVLVWASPELLASARTAAKAAGMPLEQDVAPLAWRVGSAS